MYIQILLEGYVSPDLVVRLPTLSRPGLVRFPDEEMCVRSKQPLVPASRNM